MLGLPGPNSFLISSWVGPLWPNRIFVSIFPFSKIRGRQNDAVLRCTVHRLLPPAGSVLTRLGKRVGFDGLPTRFILSSVTLSSVFCVLGVYFFVSTRSGKNNSWVGLLWPNRSNFFIFSILLNHHKAQNIFSQNNCLAQPKFSFKISIF